MQHLDWVIWRLYSSIKWTIMAKLKLKTVVSTSCLILFLRYRCYPQQNTLKTSHQKSWILKLKYNTKKSFMNSSFPFYTINNNIPLEKKKVFALVSVNSLPPVLSSSFRDLFLISVYRCSPGNGYQLHKAELLKQQPHTLTYLYWLSYTTL